METKCAKFLLLLVLPIDYMKLCFHILYIRLYCSASLDEKSVGKHGKHPTARDLLHNVVPLLYYDGEIMEAALTALGMVNPIVFRCVLVTVFN